NGTISAQAIVARAVAWEAGGNGGTSIGSPPPAITGPASLPSWTRDRSHPSTTVTASGGAGTYTWSASGLPGGLSINSATGMISGTPTTTGASSVVVTVTDAAGATATRTYSLVVNAVPLTVSSVVLGNANGQVAKGDSVTITFNKAVAVNSMCSAWSGNAS